LRGRDLLHALLEDHVPVRHLDRLGVGEVDLVLAAAPFALARFHRHPRGIHLVADGSEQGFLLRRLQGVVVDAVIARGDKIAVVRRRRLAIRVLEEEEFQFARHKTGEPPPGQFLDLPPQDRARRLGHERTIRAAEVTDHQRRRRLPRQHPHGREIRAHGEIAEA
jgi:hypothetical protein